MAGARPNYMKVKPVMDALEERGAQVILVHTRLSSPWPTRRQLLLPSADLPGQLNYRTCGR